MELIFKIICCSAVFIGFYHFVLQREKMFRFNRFYLIATLVLSFTIPFMELGIREFSTSELEEFIPQIQQNAVIKPVGISIPQHSVPENILPATVEVQKTVSFPSWSEILVMIPFLISFLLLIRFAVNLWKINRLAIKNERIKKQGFTLVKINQNVSPFSFFHYLFASKQEVENEKIQSEIFYHEFAHIKQKHSWDVVFVELLMVFFWFNPFLYVYRKSIRTNHEFLADEEVLNHHFDTTAYQHLLLEKIPVRSQTVLSSSFNYLVTKKRLIMMTKKTSRLKTVALKFFSIPLLAVVMLLFSEKVSAQIEPGKGVSKELFREYKKQVRKATVKVKDENGNKTQKVDASKLDSKLMNEVYAQMSPEQKMKVQPVPKPENNLELDSNDLDIKFDLADLDFLLSDLDFAKSDIDFNISDLDFGLSDLSFDLAELGKDINSAEFLKSIEEIKIDTKNLEEYLKSPKFKEKIEKIESNAKEIEKKYNSPEFREKMERIEKRAGEIEKYYESPEFKKRIEKIERRAKEMENQIDTSFNFGNGNIQKIMAAIEMNPDSPEYKKLVEELREEFNTDKPIKVKRKMNGEKSKYSL